MKVAIVSLNFSPGHIAHLKAYQELFLNITDNVSLYVAPEYKKFLKNTRNIVYTNDVFDIVNSSSDLVFIYNISTKNIKLVNECKKRKIRTVYVLHEPKASFKDLLAEGHAIPKAIGAYIVNSKICRKVSKVLLASETGKLNYEKYMKKLNNNYDVFPLIFTDQFDNNIALKRMYFSFIGGFSDAHGCNEFIEFLKYAISNRKNVKFLIATKNNLDQVLKDELLKKAINLGQLKVQHGRPMTTEEINNFYRQSICVWNAYNRSTQSGVLPNSLMQGAPLIVNRNGVAKEVIKNNDVGVFINMPPNNEEVFNAYTYINDHIQYMEEEARNKFLKCYCYTNFIDLAKKVIFEEKVI